jgi:AcrR family transcriptional regulator
MDPARSAPTPTAMTQRLAATPRPTDKAAALLAAALRLIAQTGLHGTPTAAIAREAGVAHGTLFLYFPTKEALFNSLYLELLDERKRVTSAIHPLTSDRSADLKKRLWPTWRALARWHLDRPDVARVMQQLGGSGVLTAATRAAEQRARAADLRRLRAAIADGNLRKMTPRVFRALYDGPMQALAEADRDGGSKDVSDAELRATFEGVCRAVLPTDA